MLTWSGHESNLGSTPLNIYLFLTTRPGYSSMNYLARKIRHHFDLNDLPKKALLPDTIRLSILDGVRKKVTAAFQMAAAARRPKAGLLHHSERGVSKR